MGTIVIKSTKIYEVVINSHKSFLMYLEKMNSYDSAEPDTDYAYRKVLELSMNKIYPKFNAMFIEVCNV